MTEFYMVYCFDTRNPSQMGTHLGGIWLPDPCLFGTAEEAEDYCATMPEEVRCDYRRVRVGKMARRDRRDRG